MERGSWAFARMAAAEAVAALRANVTAAEVSLVILVFVVVWSGFPRAFLRP